MAKERQRRRRARIRAGRRLLPIEVDDVNLGVALAAEGVIDPMRDDDPEELKEGLQRVIERWLSRHA
jgi:hypothetical protein